MKQLISVVNYWTLLLLIVLIAMSYHPIVREASRGMGIESGSILSPYILIVFAGLTVLSSRSLFRYKMQRRSWLLLFIVFLAYIFAYAFFKNDEMLSDIRSLGISLCAIGIGCNLNLNEKKYKFLLLFYAGLFTFVGIMNIMHGLGGFVIERVYLRISKNILGVNIATSILIYVAFILDSSVRKKRKWFFCALVALSFLIVLTLRARTATLCSGIIIFYAVYAYNLRKSFRNAIFKSLGIFILVIMIALLIPTVRDYIYDSFTMGHEDDLLSGRTERNEVALDFFLDNLFLGNVQRHVELAWVHNYPLLKLSSYGILLSLPILLLYLYQLIFTLKKSLYVQRDLLGSLGYIALLIPFICSMNEPTLPYGPGTGTVFNFILLGLALSYDNKV